jgi:octaprenyl-diphosphate synthase
VIGLLGSTGEGGALTGLSANLCSLSFSRVKPVGRLFERNRQENRVTLFASVDQAAAVSRPSLDPLFRLLVSDLEAVNRLIVERMKSPVALIPQLAGHIVASGGKRLRPMLTLGCARLCGYIGARHVALAAAVEFIHTATLLHDDVVDASDLRRGRDTANALWGNKPAILVGDFLFSRSFELMVADGSLRILEILSRASSVIAEGEVLQLMTQNDLKTTEESYLEVIRAKTAELFAAASRIGAIVAERPHDEEMALDCFGRDLGVAFQLVDDMLDFSARQAELGKKIGDDFREGKVTLPILLAFSRGDEAERAFWRRALENMDQHAGDLEHALVLVERHGALAETLCRARSYAASAIQALSVFPDGPERCALIEAASFAAERSA